MCYSRHYLGYICLKPVYKYLLGFVIFCLPLWLRLKLICLHFYHHRMKDRLSKFITSEGLTPSLLADKLGVHRSGISHILSGRNNARFDFIKNLLEIFPKLNADWLILGQGPMYKSNEMKTIDLFSYEKTQLSPTPSYEKTSLSPTLPEKPQILSHVEGDKNSTLDKPTDISPPTKHKKTIERIVFFYTDKTFATYHPEDTLG